MTAILALDFSTNTGIAFGRPGDVPVLSTEKFARWEGATVGEVASGVLRWIPQLLTVYRPDLVLLEGALPSAAQSNEAAARIALGGAFVIKGQCSIEGIRLIEVKAKDWQFDIHGTARLKRDEGKKKSKQIAQEFGLSPRNYDEADAFCLWLHGMKKYAGFYPTRMQQVLAKAQHRLVA